jgi:hypothetical protein
MTKPVPRARVEMPVIHFLFTLDQIALLMSVSEETLRKTYVYFEGRSTGTKHGKMSARNIASEYDKPDWRVAEANFRAFLRSKGYEVYDPRIYR